MKPRTKARTQIIVGVIFSVLGTLGTVLVLTSPHRRKDSFVLLLYVFGTVCWISYLCTLLLKNRTGALLSFCGVFFYYFVDSFLIRGSLDIAAMVGTLLGFSLAMALAVQGYLGLLNLEKLDKDSARFPSTKTY